MSNETKRPLSPHLQVYRLPYNALMSISGRAAGIILSASVVVMCLFFCLFAWLPESYSSAMTALDHPFFSYLFLLWAFGFFFYIGNGLRHYLWDHLIGLNQRSGIITGNIVLVISALLTLGLWCTTQKHQTETLAIQEELINE